MRLVDGEGLKGNFVQFRHLAGFVKPIRSKGEFYLLPGVGLIWQTVSPVSSRMIIDEGTVTHSMGGDVVSRISIQQFPALKVLKAALENSLAGNWEYLETLAGESLKKTQETWTLRYEPKVENGKTVFREVLFVIGDYLERAEILKDEGDTDIILFSNQTVLPKEEILPQFKAGGEADK